MACRIKPEEYKIDMTPMIDCVFLLLIFFMCAAKFKTLESKLQANLPQDMGEAKGAPPPEVTPRRVELKVETYTQVDGKRVVERVTLRLGEEELGTYLRPFFAYDDVSRKKDLIAQRNHIYEELKNRLMELERMQATGVRSPTFIAPDLRIPTDDVVQALDAVVGAGITDLTFAGKISDIPKLRKEDGIEE